MTVTSSTTLETLGALAVAHDALLEGRDARAPLADAPAWAVPAKLLGVGRWADPSRLLVDDPHSYEAILDDYRRTVRREFGDSIEDPDLYGFVPRHARALADAWKTVQELSEQMLPDTATGEDLDRAVGLTRLDR